MGNVRKTKCAINVIFFKTIARYDDKKIETVEYSNGILVVIIRILLRNPRETNVNVLVAVRTTVQTTLMRS